MFDKLTAKFFPCEKVMQNLMDEHATSVRKNEEAHERLLRACSIDGNNKKKEVERYRDCYLSPRIRH